MYVFVSFWIWKHSRNLKNSKRQPTFLGVLLVVLDCNFFHCCFVLSIATSVMQRGLQTILDCDRIMVLAQGEIVELDTPEKSLGVVSPAFFLGVLN